MAVFKDDRTGNWKIKAYYNDWTGERRQLQKKGFTTKREAAAYERNFLEKEAKQSDILFKNFVENYFDDMKTRIRKTSLDHKERIINLKILPYFENKPLNKITPQDIRKWQSVWLDTEYSPAYLRSIHAQLSALFNYAVRYYNLTTNPAKVAGVMGKDKFGEMSIWTIEEFEQFISALKKPEHTIMFKVLFWTGIRSGELLALTKKDIKSDRICVNKTFTVLGKEKIINPPKTPKSNREVTIPQFLHDDLQSYIGSIYGLKANDRIFPYTRAKLYKIIHKYAIKAGVKEIRTHDLRHSHASMLIEKGYNVLLVAERLGHENPDVTLNTYSHLYPNKQEQLADDLQKIKEG